MLEIAFQVVTGLAMGALAWALETWVLGIFAYLFLIGIPRRNRILTAAASVRREFPEIVTDAATIPDDQGQAVFLAARDMAPGAGPRPVAAIMEQILDACRRPPGVLATVGLIGLWGVAVLLALFAAVYHTLSTHEGEWVTYRAPELDYEVSFPTTPRTAEREQETPAGKRRAVVAQASHGGLERYTAEHFTLDAPIAPEALPAWYEMMSDDVGRPARAERSRERPVTLADGLEGREVDLKLPHRQWRVRMFTRNARFYRLTASAPVVDEPQRRFLESFALAGTSTLGAGDDRR